MTLERVAGSRTPTHPVPTGRMSPDLATVRSMLFLPASNARAVAKARGLAVDLVVLDLEDAVRAEDKDAARLAAVEATGMGMGAAASAIRVNAVESAHHEADMVAVRSSAADFAILPMVVDADEVARFAAAVGKPVLAMIETAGAVLDCADIARAEGVAGLVAGVNDLCAETGIRNEAGRAGLVTALQTMVLAARAARVAAFDGVFNRIDAEAGFAREAAQGVAFGFTGKALIHPSQVEPCNRAFSPSAAQVEEAEALIAAATAGAARFRGRMVEDLHVHAARRVLGRAER